MMAGLASATDVFNEEFFEDPYPSYHRFRHQDPVLQLPFDLQLEQAQETYHDDADSWLVTGFSACSEALRNHQVDTAGDGAADAVSALAEPLPILVIASLIGVPPEDLPQFKEWSDAMVALPTPETITSNRAKTLLGIHFCLGAPLARLEESVVLDELLERYPSISRAAPAQFQRMSRVIRGLTALPIDFTGR